MASKPILYSFRRCPYAMRARLAIAVSGMACELREIVLRDKAPEFLITSPKATVPVLIDDGQVIEESIDIIFWALGRNDPENWLAPEIGTLEEMQLLITEGDGPFKDHLDRYKYASRHDDVDSDEEREAASEFLFKLNVLLSDRVYLFGGRISLADMALAPFVRQFANVDRGWFDAQPWPNLLRWLTEFLESERFQSIMEKYPKWQVGNKETIFPSL
ncbi:MAG: glutathione S-transferase [Rhizobiaceae bacterium]|nr:glutathione S-transferase [Rhizobiaceae bacterium]